MRIKCNRCHQQLGEPVALAGIFTWVPAAIITAITCSVIECVIHGWAFLIAIPLWVFLTWILCELPRWRAMLRYYRHPCPKCGACDWARPQYSGFGL